MIGLVRTVEPILRHHSDAVEGLEIFNGHERIMDALIRQATLSILQGGGNDKVIILDKNSC